MNPNQYAEGRQKAQELEYKVRDWLDDRSSSLGQQLLEEARRVEDDFQTQRNPRSIEDRIKKLLHLYEELRRFETPIMDSEHARWLHDQYEHLQLSLRKFENY